MMWKALVKDFPLIDNWLAWNVGKGNMFKIIENPWVRCLANFRFSNTLLVSLHNQSSSKIAYVRTPN
jgi:hypothetical protein